MSKCLSGKQAFDLSKPWESLTNDEKAAFSKKVKHIEIEAILLLANNANLDFDTVYENVTHLNPEWEWDDTDKKSLPADVNWIFFEVQFMLEELADKKIIDG